MPSLGGFNNLGVRGILLVGTGNYLTEAINRAAHRLKVCSR
jgi:hypothetical protein